LHAVRIGIADAYIIAVLAKVGCRAVGSVGPGRFLAPSASGPDRRDARSIVGLGEPGGSPGALEDCSSQGSAVGRLKKATSVQCFVLHGSGLRWA